MTVPCVVACRAVSAVVFTVAEYLIVILLAAGKVAIGALKTLDLTPLLREFQQPAQDR